MRKTRYIALILALIFVLSLAVSCGNDEKDESSAPADESKAENVSAADESSAEEVSEAPKGPLDHLETQFLDRECIFLVENQNGGGYGSKEIVPNTEISSVAEAIAPHIQERNDLIFDKLGVTIDEIRTDNMANDLRNAALTVPEFDIACPYLTTAGPLITEGIFYDLYEFDDIINFDAPYWDQNAAETLSVGNKLYVTTGDFSLGTLDVTHCMLFNKQVAADKGLESPYQLVKDGKWTMDKMLEMAKAVTAESDGEDGITYKDTIGLFINGNYSNSLFIGSGESFVKKDGNGVPQLVMYNENSANVVQKIFDVFHDDAAIYMEGYNAKAMADGFTNCYWASRDRLANNGALFVTISLSDIFNLDTYDTSNIGFLVTPKFTEEQDTYHSYISIIYATGCVIPVGNEDPEFAALVLEALNASSTDIVKHNYYDRILKGQKTSDEDSDEMLNYIFDNRVYDLGAMMWTNMRDVLTSVCVTASSNNFTSTYESNEGTYLKQMEDLIDFAENN